MVVSERYHNFGVGDIEKTMFFMVRKIDSHVPSVARGSMGRNIIRE